MLAEQNPILEEAVMTMYEITAEVAVREQCRAREEYYRTINTIKAKIQNRENALEELKKQLAMKDNLLEQQTKQIAELFQKMDNLMNLQAMP